MGTTDHAALTEALARFWMAVRVAGRHQGYSACRASLPDLARWDSVVRITRKITWIVTGYRSVK